MSEQQIRVGDRVKSFDFPDNPFTREGEHACFVIGTVESIRSIGGGDHFVIRVEEQVFDGKVTQSHPEFVTPPVNGRPKMFGGVTDGVVRA